MDWTLEDAIAYYQKQGAPADQTALTSLLREVQQESGGGIPRWTLPRIAQAYGIRESYLQAVIKRIPSLRLADSHELVLCGGPNCSKRAALAAFAEKNYGKTPNGVTIKYSGCMRHCGKGPNLKWDGKLYHGADEALIRALMEGKEQPE